MELCALALPAALSLASAGMQGASGTPQQTLVAGMNATGAYLAIAQLPQANKGNLVLSPYSAAMAHLMLAYGCKGDDRTELLKSLGLQDLATDQAILDSAGLQKILTSIAGVPFTSADAFATVGDAKAVDGFKAAVQDTFGGEFFSLTKEGALDAINKWAADKSKNRIPKLLDEMPMAQGLFLLNAATFDGVWTRRFQPHRSTPGEPTNFTTADGTKIVAETMRRRAAPTDFVSADTFDAVALPYRDQEFEMVVMLPHTGSGPSDVLNELRTGGLPKILAGMQQDNYEVVLPKFTISSICDLTAPLRNLGITRIFDGFDGTRMATMATQQPDQVVVDLQRAYIEVDETGTKAAAVTAIGIMPTAIIGGGPVPKEFIVDRPFAYAIVHKKTGLMIFLGVCSTPPQWVSKLVSQSVR
jgi:serpin B